MVWTAPMTAVANTVFTAAQFNTFVRDNLNETSPAKSTMVSSHFVGMGLNSIVERRLEVDDIATSETTTSVTYTDLATPGPSVTLNTGERAMVFFRAGLENNTVNAGSFMSFDVTGASALSATDTAAINIAGTAANTRSRFGTGYLLDALTPGSNTFTAKYKVSAGTGTFNQRQLAVFPL